MTKHADTRRRRGTLRGLVRHDGGTAAVEFALILPILVVLWFGGVEVTQALSVDRHLNNLASAIGDLSARSKEMKFSTVDQIFDLAPGAMYPYSSSGLQMRVTALDIDADNNLTMAWSRSEGVGITPYTADDNDNLSAIVPDALKQFSDSQIIMAEVYYTYTPAVGYVVTGSIGLSDRVFFVPRLTDHVALCDNNGENCTS
jgi:Flp pilus assembly protein TadG